MADLAEQPTLEMQAHNEKSAIQKEEDVALEKIEEPVEDKDADAKPQPGPETEQAEANEESKPDDTAEQPSSDVVENTTNEEVTQPNVPIDFVTMGMFIIG